MDTRLPQRPKQSPIQINMILEAIKQLYLNPGQSAMVKVKKGQLGAAARLATLLGFDGVMLPKHNGFLMWPRGASDNWKRP